MRLRRLDLIRYGHFTGRVIDFGEAREGRPDFHVIHGPNEAGKSTLFAAWLDLLYGIDTRSSYNFLHDYKTMRIGAALETGTGARYVTRIKKPVTSLLDENDQPLSESLLAAELGGLDRKAYETMFSLDETSLEQGGEAILESKGDLGQLLFSASAGLSDLARRLDGVRAETEAFHKSRAQKTLLADLKRRLDELRQEREAIDFAAADHQRLVAERDGAKALHDEVNRRRADARVRLDRASRRLAAMPQRVRLESLRRELADLVPPPPAPATWAAEIPTIRRREVELATEIARLERDRARVEAALAEHAARDPILDVSGDIDDLAGLAGRALSEEDDLPNRLAERAMADRQIDARLRGLGRDPTTDPRGLLLDARRVGRLKGLIADHASVVQSLAAAGREVESAERSWSEAREALERQTGMGADLEPGALAGLAEVLAVVRAVDHEQRRARAVQALASARNQLNRRLSALAPWRGDLVALAGLKVPAASVVAGLVRRLDEAAAAVGRASAECAAQRGELAGLEAERAAVAQTAGTVADEEAVRVRAEREEAWALHRRKLDAESADAFRQALDADDRLAERRLAQSAEVARLRTLDHALARARARKLVSDEALSACVAARESSRTDLAALIAGVSPDLPVDMSADTFEAWCAAVAEARAALDLAASAEDDLKAVEQSLALARTRLTGAMIACGAEPGADDMFEQMIERARTLVDAGTRREALFRSFREREDELSRRHAALASAEKARAAWLESWHAACAGTWLAERGELPSTVEMEEILDSLRKLEVELDGRDGIRDRIGKMERDIAAFSEAVKCLSDRLGIATGESARQLYRLLTTRLSAARAAEERRGIDLERHRLLADELAGLAAEKAALESRIAAMTAHFGAETLDGVEENLAVIERCAVLAAEVETASRDLMESLGAATVSELDAEFAEMDRAALELEIETLKPECDALDEEAARAYATWAAARDRLSSLGGDDAAARLAAERRTVLMEIEDGARRYLELRLGALATDQALRLYRDRHRSSMMTRASDAFVRIAPSYAGLSTHRDGQRETLVAIGADGSSKGAGDLSKGTQFQLYLALRIAGYQEYAAGRPPVPFVADDVMESFDEVRSAAALAQLSVMARSGQVIYLTHHRHICEIAKTVCPDVTLHAL